MFAAGCSNPPTQAWGLCREQGSARNRHVFISSPRSYLLLKCTNPEPDLETKAAGMETAANVLLRQHLPCPREKGFTYTALKSKGARVSQDSHGRKPWAPDHTSLPDKRTAWGHPCHAEGTVEGPLERTPIQRYKVLRHFR